MKRFILTVACLLFLVTPMQAQSVSRAVLWGGTGFDIGTTMYGIKRDDRREANPILPKKPVPLAATVVGLTALSDWTGSKLAKQGHPKLANAVRFAGGGLHIFAGVWNLKGRNGLYSCGYQVYTTMPGIC